MSSAKPATSTAAKDKVKARLRPPTFNEYGDVDTWTRLLRQENDLRNKLQLPSVPVMPRFHMSTPIEQQLEKINILTERLGAGSVYDVKNRRALSPEERAELTDEDRRQIRDFRVWQDLSANPYQTDAAQEMIMAAAINPEKNQELVSWMNNTLSFVGSTERVPALPDTPTSMVYNLAANIGGTISKGMTDQAESGTLDYDDLEPAFIKHMNSPVFTGGYNSAPLEVAFSQSELADNYDLSSIFADVMGPTGGVTSWPTKTTQQQSGTTRSQDVVQGMKDMNLFEEEEELVAPATPGFWSNLAETYDAVPGGWAKDLVVGAFGLPFLGAAGAAAATATGVMGGGVRLAEKMGIAEKRPPGLSTTGELAKALAPSLDKSADILPSKDEPSSLPQQPPRGFPK